MRLKSIPLGIIVVTVIFGGVLLTTLTGWWSTESRKVPASFTEGEFAGQYNPADIRGSYTFGDIESAFKVPAADLKLAFAPQMEGNPASIAVKSLEEFYAAQAAEGKEIGTTSVRYFVALYAGLPFTVSGDIYFPQAAVDLLKAKAALSSEQAAYLDAHAVSISAAAPAAQSAEPSAAAPTPPAAAEEQSTRQIKGKTTFQELLDWGLPSASIEKALGVPLPAPQTTLKDFCTQQNLDWEGIKTALQAEVDALP